LIKSGDVQWEEVEEVKEPDNAINYILQQRKKFGWNITLPVNGAQARYGMDTYQDRVDSDLKKTLDDDGHFKYALCISDIKENILYSPYELRIVTGEIAKKYPVYYTVSASYISKVGSYLFFVFVCAKSSNHDFWRFCGRHKKKVQTELNN
jgi:hypothetical protein